jgi:hypothetical protein
MANQFYHKSNFDLYLATSKIPNSGMGVFTRCFIPKASYIDDYYGDIIEYLCGGPYCFEIGEGFSIDAQRFPRCYMAMLNDASYRPTSKRKLKTFVEHGCINNCEFVVDLEQHRIRVFSFVDIEPNSELFVSYGEDYWN